MSVWGITRTTVPTPLQLTRIEVILETLNIHIDEVHSSDHSDDACYILPIIEEGEPVILQGQCDPNIPVVQDFLPGDVSIY